MKEEERKPQQQLEGRAKLIFDLIRNSDRVRDSFKTALCSGSSLTFGQTAFELNKCIATIVWEYSSSKRHDIDRMRIEEHSLLRRGEAIKQIGSPSRVLQDLQSQLSKFAPKVKVLTEDNIGAINAYLKKIDLGSFFEQAERRIAVSSEELKEMQQLTLTGAHPEIKQKIQDIQLEISKFNTAGIGKIGVHRNNTTKLIVALNKMISNSDDLEIEPNLRRRLSKDLQMAREIPVFPRKKDLDRVCDLLDGMRLDQPFEATHRIQKGTILAQYVGIYGVGNFFTPLDENNNPTLPTNLGIHDHKKVGDGVEKKRVSYFVAEKDMYVNRSLVSPADDSWSIPGEIHPTEGGGV